MRREGGKRDDQFSKREFSKITKKIKGDSQAGGEYKIPSLLLRKQGVI